MNPKISLIVPVYKAEKYLHRCVDSILVQTFTNFELILVDDGSPDSCGDLCDKYAQKDNRVKVIHKKNGGVASARQCGIDNATGIYTIHADPDDWVEPTMLEELYNKAVAENADMIICDFFVNAKSGHIYRKQKITGTKTSIILNDILHHRLHGSLCNKLIKLSCYKDFGITFATGINYCEDYLICVKMLTHNIKVSYLNKAFYYYDQIVNDDSITRKYTLETYRQRCKFIDELKKALKKEEYQDGIIKNEACIAAECINHDILTKEEYIRLYSKNKWTILRNIKNKRAKLKFIRTIFLK